MFPHESTKEPNQWDFITAMVNEVTYQMYNGNVFVIPKNWVPTGVSIVTSVWKMNLKQNINTRDIKECKAHLNIYGSREIRGIHYEQTYMPAASWNSIILPMILSSVHKWKTV